MPLPAARGIAELRARLAELEPLQRRDAAFEAWHARTRATLRAALGDESPAHNDFATIRTSPRISTLDGASGASAAAFATAKGKFAAVIEGAIFELELANESADDSNVSPVLDVVELRKLETFITAYRKAADAGDLDALDPDTRAQADREVEAVESLRKAPEPKRALIRPLVRSIRAVLEGALGAAIGSGLVAAAQEAAHVIR